MALLLKRSIFSVITVISICFSVYAQQQERESKLNPRLKFNTDGTFKVVQFTDIHYENGSSKNGRLLAMIADILDREHPDIVLLTGDIVTSRPVESGWKVVVKPFIQRKIPWAVVLGNHDDKYDLNRNEIMVMLKKMPYSLVQPGPKYLGGSGNYVLRVKDSRGRKNMLLLYCLDSNAYTPIKGVGKYGWIKFRQIEWFRQRSAHFTSINDNRPIPGAAFFHIPLPEFNEMWEPSGTKCIGRRNDDVCAPAINSGMFASLRETEGIMGVFAGHDHNNDYAGCFHDICLAYGRVSGFDGYGTLRRGARVIEFIEGKYIFNSWIRTEDGKTVNRFTFPKSF